MRHPAIAALTILGCAGLAGCNAGADSYEDGAGSRCAGVRYGEVCFTVLPLLARSEFYDNGQAVFHQFEGEDRPVILGVMDHQLYVARLLGNTFDVSTAPLEASTSSPILVGDFAGDGVDRIVLRSSDADTIHAVDATGLVGAPLVIPLQATWAPAAALDMSDGTSVLVASVGGVDSAIAAWQTFRLEGDAWAARSAPFMAPYYLAWSLDVNGDRLRDVVISSFPLILRPDDPLFEFVPVVRIHVLVSDGLGGFTRFEHELDLPCGTFDFSRNDLTGDGIPDLTCFIKTADWEPLEGDHTHDGLRVYVLPGKGNGEFGVPEEIFSSKDPNDWYLRGFANLDGVGLDDLVHIRGSTSGWKTFVLAAPWTAAAVKFDFDVWAMTAADLNGDGIEDLVVHNGDGAYVLLSN